MRRALVVVALVAFAASCAPTPDLVVKSAKELGAFQASGVNGRDGGATASTSAGVVWIFGDTFLKTADVDGTTLHSSSFSLAPAGLARPTPDRLTTTTDAAGADAPFLDATDDERAFNLAHQAKSDGTCAQSPCGARFATWPGTTVSNGDQRLTFYGLISAAPGDYNFHGLGQSLATWSASDATPKTTRPNLSTDPSSPHPTLLFGASEPTFGVAAANDGDDVVVFGCDNAGLSTPCKLARVKTAHILERKAWTFFDGTQYVADLSKAATVVDAAPIATLTKIDCAWLLVYSAPLSNDVVARAAVKPEGPWSGPVKLFTADHGDDGDVYDAYLHPELGGIAEGRLELSYTRNTPAPFTSETVVESVDLDVTKLCPAS